VTTDPRWLPWIGCWTPATATTEVVASLVRTQRVCVMPAEGSDGVDVVNVADGQVVSRVRVDATGERRPVSREGCAGWETARWSAAGGRVYLRSELVCAGGIERASSGIIAITSPGDWVDVEVVRVRDQRSTRVVRYRSAPDSTAVDREIATALGGQEMARRAARMSAAALPTITDVIEASRELDPATVEAWLLQRMPRFAVDAPQLRRLAKARVPGAVIDLVVALSSPEIFRERLATRGYTLVRVDPVRQPVVVAESQASSVDVSPPAVIVEGSGYDERSHRDRCDRCSDSQIIIYDATPNAPYGYYPYWPYGAYPSYPSYPYYPYDPYPYDPYRPRPRPPRQPQTPSRPPVIVNGPSYEKPRPTQPAPSPAPEPVNGRAINGRGYTRPGTSAPATTPPPAAQPSQPESAPVVEAPRQAQPRQAEPRQAPEARSAPEPRKAPEPRYVPAPRSNPAPTPPPPSPEPKPAPPPAPVAEPKPPATRPEPPPRTAKPRPPAGD
jgi:hypothetical protein